MSELTDEFVRAMRIVNGLTTSIPMMLMTKERIEQLETTGVRCPTMRSLCGTLRKLLCKIVRPEDYVAMSQAYEAYAEANTVLALAERSVKLDRTPGTGGHGQKRPDFVHHHASGDIYFEVKALEIAAPLQRHKEIAEDGLAMAADLDERSREPGVHFGEQSISGHLPDASTSERIDEIAKRIKNVIKPGQIQYGPTILVVDLGRLPICALGPSQLLPVFFHDGPPAESCVSGELWQIALGMPGERIFKLPEFDGASNLCGHQTEQGVLRSFPSLMAITFQSLGWNKPTDLFTIWNRAWDCSSQQNSCTLSQSELEELLRRFSDGLNNDRNELGWDYRTTPLRPPSAAPDSYQS